MKHQKIIDSSSSMTRVWRLFKFLQSSTMVVFATTLPVLATVSEFNIEEDVERREKFLEDLREKYNSKRWELFNWEIRVSNYNKKITDSYRVQTAKWLLLKKERPDAQIMYRVFVKSERDGLYLPPVPKFVHPPELEAGPKELYSKAFPSLRAYIDKLWEFITEYTRVLGEYERWEDPPGAIKRLDELEIKIREFLSK